MQHLVALTFLLYVFRHSQKQIRAVPFPPLTRVEFIQHSLDTVISLYVLHCSYHLGN